MSFRLLLVLTTVWLSAGPAAAAIEPRPDRWNFVYAAYVSGLLLVVGYAVFVAVRLIQAERRGGAS
jgi:hypothetical protein